MSQNGCREFLCRSKLPVRDRSKVIAESRFSTLNTAQCAIDFEIDMRLKLGNEFALFCLDVPGDLVMCHGFCQSKYAAIRDFI